MQRLLDVVTAFTLVGALLTAVPGLLAMLAQVESPDVVFRVATEQRVVALTIDDGPSPATPAILDVLADHDAAATFFVIGEHLDGREELARRLVAGGHELGHHMLRDERSLSLPPDVFVAQFDSVHRQLQELGGSTVFRPGSGWYDERMVTQARRRGYRTVLGSVYPFDAQLPFPRLASWYMLQKVSPGDILILHDGPERGRRAAEVLRRVLPELRRRGYDVVPVSRLLEMAGER